MTVIVGLGQTGLSCARFLRARQRTFVLMDDRTSPPNISEIREEFADYPLVLGSLDSAVLNSASEILLSPGVALSRPEIQEAIGKGVKVRGDIDLFSEFANAPVVAITGSNGKSTVTTLVGEMARKNGTRVAVGGNIGVPALSLLDENVELYVLELSSFQLETTEKLNATAVTLLNISEDHMDRYPSKMAYLQAKQRIFFGAKTVVINDDEPLSQPMARSGMKLIHYGLNGQDLNKFSVSEGQGKRYLTKGFDQLVSVADLGAKGQHNVSNTLAAIALGSAVGLPMTAMIAAAKEFRGLPHRCESVRTIKDVDYVNDSKGTNAGASVVAISSFGCLSSGKVLLIAGGEAKGADLSPLHAPMAKYGREAIVFGRDADKVSQALDGAVDVKPVADLREAVALAHQNAQAGDVVLFSPACASFDMFENFEHRGRVFCEEVRAL